MLPIVFFVFTREGYVSWAETCSQIVCCLAVTNTLWISQTMDVHSGDSGPLSVNVGRAQWSSWKLHR